MSRRSTVAMVFFLSFACGFAIWVWPHDQPVKQDHVPPVAKPAELTRLQPRQVEQVLAETPQSEPLNQVPLASPFARFTLRVEQADGAPAAGATVRFSQGTDSVHHDADRSGAVSGWLSAGTWTIRANGNGLSTGTIEVTLIEGQVRALTLVLQPERRIAGVVVNGSGEVIEHAKVTVTSGRFTTANLSARFSADVTGKDVIVTANAEGFGRGATRVEAPNENVRLVLGPGAALEVSVIDHANTNVRDAFVDVTVGDFHEPSDSRAFDGPLSTRKEILLRTVPPGLATVRAVRMSARGFERAAREILLKPGERTHAVLQLRAGTGLEGLVVDPNGRPMGQVRVVALRVDDDPMRTVSDFERSVMSAQTDPNDAVGFSGPDGKFDLVPTRVGSPDAKYRIHVLGPGLREPEHRIILELGGPPAQVKLVPVDWAQSAAARPAVP